jgi:hypothetical protein
MTYRKIFLPVELKIIKLGNSAGVILPRALLAHLHVRIGDTILASETPGLHSAYRLQPGLCHKDVHSRSDHA